MEEISLSKVWDKFFESMIITNQQGDLLNLNRSAKRLFNINLKNLHNTSIFELFPEKLNNYFLQRLETTGISLPFGTEELLLTIIPMNDHFLLIFKNMTTKFLYQHQMEELTQKIHSYDSLLDKLDEGVCVINEEEEIIFYNKKIGEINSRETESIKNRKLFDAFPNLEKENSKLYKTLKLGKSLNHRETHFTSDGKELTILSRTYPLIVGNRKMGAIEILNDITEKKQLEYSLKHLKNNNRTSNTTTEQKSNKQPSNNTRFVFSNIIYQSREMGRIIELAKRASQTPSNILIYGETGTGKELFAQSIHNESPRKKQKFFAQNCAAIPENLLEGILFGTSEGSFTGAIERSGIFEQANGGTLLLDEINSMGTNLQAKLLRVIQEKKVTRLGSNVEKNIDVRIIATLNEDPQVAIKEGRLREDLFYRLGVVNIIIQPLRKRKTDINVLINFFIEKHSKALNININGIEEEVMGFFQNYSWPGNVRQLEHVIEGALNLIHDDDTITFDHLPFSFQQLMLEANPVQSKQIVPTRQGTLKEQLENLEIELINRAMKDANGNTTKAGKQLGISRQSLNYKLKKYKIPIIINNH